MNVVKKWKERWSRMRLGSCILELFGSNRIALTLLIEPQLSPFFGGKTLPCRFLKE
uniref:Uncharacterized protein n=1 Tax=Echinococcus granulosus TaxID=6210 RepID=A0A068WS41_ECHGR|nr:hypothetical protein EgrG_000696400 [Echinococcus granulosus]